MKNICMIGTGYVGLVTGAGLSDFGNNVSCVDIDSEKIAALNAGKIPIYEPGLKELVQRNVDAKRLSFTTNIDQAIQSAEVIFIAVGTPMGDDGAADLRAVEAVAKTIAANLTSYKVICTKSTVPVGTGAKIQKIISTNKQNDVDFDIVSNPEFLREGAAVGDFLIPDRVVLGVSSKHAEDVMRSVYRPLFINETPMVITNVATSELIKYASNAFLAVKISFINEMANLADAVGADIHVIAKAMGLDGRISAKFLHPGPGYGGSCFPKDTEALVYAGKQAGISFKVVDAAIQANSAQRDVIFNKLKELLPNLVGKKIAVLGLAFKANTDDVRDSPAVDIIKKIEAEGGHVVGFDPVAAENMKKFYLPNLELVEDAFEAMTGASAIIILTEWNELRGLDLNKVKEIMAEPNIIDARNILSIAQMKKLGFSYRNVGRSQV